MQILRFKHKNRVSDRIVPQNKDNAGNGLKSGLDGI